MQYKPIKLQDGSIYMCPCKLDSATESDISPEHRIILELSAMSSNAVLGDGWRDCMEELPEESGDCIVYTNDNRIEIDEFTTQFGWYVDRIGGKVIAWMPLSAIGKPVFA